MMLASTPETVAHKRKVVCLSQRQRLVLHRLLHREMRKCSVAVLSSIQRCGWITGEGSGYELTARGRHLAEVSENASPNGDLEVEL